MRPTKTIFFLLLLAPLLFASINCKDEPPVKQETNPLQLTVEGATCTEAFLKLSLADGETNRTITLKRDDSSIATITVAGNDSLFVDEGLLPKKTYSYTLTAQSFTVTTQATTMDTTSHDWIWAITILGDGNGSSLYDVAIINDTLAYAVGEISIKDSLGNYQNPPYNVAKWNGKKWEFITLKWNCRLYYPNCGPETMLFSPATAVYAFGPNDIWISSGSLHHFDGTNWTEEAGFEGVGNANKIWGDPSIGLWFVGGGGFIAHRNPNGTWQKIESGTTLPINDIWGAYDEKTKSYEILCVASRTDQNEGKKLLMIKQQSAMMLPDSGLSWLLGSVWFVPNRKYYIAGDGFYGLNKIGSLWHRDSVLPSYLKSSVRGDRFNNIVVVGAFGLTVFYNGASWRSFHEKTYLSTGAYVKVSIKNNLIVAVGYSGNRGIVAIGKR